MREWLIELGKVIFGLGIAKTTNGQPPQDFQYYGIGLYFFAWHISNLEIFDTPKELSEFYNQYPKGDLPIGKWKHGLLAMKQVKRPPQSWCYIETDY